MIPELNIREWKRVAPWQTNGQVEQDLIISRALVEIFSDDLLRNSLSFRGGTALHKLYLTPQIRYSEDIPFEVNNAWFSGKCNVTGYTIEEMLSTKLKALYGRKKGRDLFDLYWA